MDEQKIRSKELALKILEKLLLENDFENSNKLMLKVLTIAKQVRERKKQKLIILACDELIKIVQNLSTEEISELTQIIRNLNH